MKKCIGENILDLCCGSGEITLSLPNYNVIGLDPYTNKSYYNRTRKNSLNLTFQDIANGKLENNFDCIICSYALHLCDKSLLPLLL